MAVCGVQLFNLTRDAIKILGYLLLVQHDPNKSKKITVKLFQYSFQFQYLKLWRMRNLSIEGKIRQYLSPN